MSGTEMTEVGHTGHAGEAGETGSAPGATAAPSIELPRPIPFGRLARVEWRKATDTRAARWLMLATAVAGAVFVAIALGLPDELSSDFRTYLDMSLTGVEILLPIIGILAITSEWTQRSALVTFVQEARRSRVIGAKLLAVTVLGLLGAVVANLLAILGLGIGSMLGREVDWNATWQVVAGSGGRMLGWALIAAAFGLIVLNSAAAIVLYIVLPMVVGILGAFDALSFLTKWVDPTTALQLVSSWDWSGNAGRVAVILGIWIALPMLAGLLRVSRREVQ